MRLVLILILLPLLLPAQGDPVFEAYKEWQAKQGGLEYKARMQSLLDASGDWVAKWPDSRLAWDQRRAALVTLRSRSAELWKQVDENLIRLSPPHTFASLAAYDWMAAGVNIKDAEALIQSEIEWQDARTRPERPAEPTLADLVDEADFSARTFDPLCTLARVQIQLKEFTQAHATIERVHRWLTGDFRRYFDQDPLEAFPDYGAKYFSLSAQLAQAEGRDADALAFQQRVFGNAYYRREYERPNYQQALWQHIGGTEEAWAAFSEVPPLPPGVPAGLPGVPFLPWVALNYKMPAMKATALDSREWTNRDFQGKATLVYLWASWCAPCWRSLAGVQQLYDALKAQPGMQLVTLSTDEDRDKLAAFMKDKGYTFPVVVSRPYVEQMLPKFILGQFWIVDGSGAVRLQRTSNNFSGAERALVEEAVYRLRLMQK